jgi:hypothetical protein
MIATLLEPEFVLEHDGFVVYSKIVFRKGYSAKCAQSSLQPGAGNGENSVIADLLVLIAQMPRTFKCGKYLHLS